jgi:hypothetical protein
MIPLLTHLEKDSLKRFLDLLYRKLLAPKGRFEC